MEIVLNKTSFLDVPIQVEPMHGVTFSNENKGHKFVVSCMRGGELLTLTGTVTARFMRANNTTILIAGNDYTGIVDGKAVVTLPQDCYNVPGRFQMAIFLTADGATSCIYACVGSVQRTQNGDLIDSGDAVPSLEELLAQIDACEQATADATAAANAVPGLVAETFATNKAYTAGSYVYYNGSLYRFTVDHAAGAWTGSDATAVKLANDVGDLKSAFDVVAKVKYTTVSGYVNAWGGISADSDVSNGTLTTENILCEPGDIIKFYINFSTEKTEWIAYALYNISGGFISRTVLYNMVSGTSFAGAITIPDNVHYIAISYRTFNESSAYIGLCSPISGIISNVSDTISIYANDVNLSVSERLDTGIMVSAGQKFKITVTNFSGAGMYVYVGANTDVRHYIGQNEEYVFTPASSGSIIFNPTGTTSANIKIHFVTVYDSKEDSSNKVTSFSSNPTNIEYPSAKLVYDKLSEIDKTISIYANDAEVTVTAPTRLDTGIPVVQGQKFKITVTDFTDAGIYLYVGNNTDVRHYIAGNEEYVFTPASSGNIIFNPDGGSANIKIHFVTVYDKENNGAAVYTVGSGGDYTTFTAMLVALEDDSSEKIVYVNPGVYDIFDEMGGAEYLASLADTASSLNWRDVCHVVPPNTTVIGIGDVQLNWLPNASDVPNNAVKVLFSPLNTSGNCHIENITINAKNCRYGLHDETSNRPEYYGAKHEYINCKIYAEGTNAIGSGHCRNQSLIFKNCVLESSSGNSVFMHDWPSPANGKSNIIFENCVVTGGILLNSCDMVGRLDSLKLFNCFITNGNIHLIADDQTNSYLQGYTIEAIGTTQLNFTHYSNVTVSQAPVEYNAQSR